MEASEELSLGAKDQAHIVKGKRTKRLRPQSPIPFSTITGGDCYNGDDNNNKNNNSRSNSPPTTSSAEFLDSTEEEEDMANCLILLAQGQSRESPKQAEEEGGMNYSKYSSRKFREAAAIAGSSGKAGFYVYECKTCNRTFPSFQALGGHRASHKKPKALAAASMANDQEKKHQQQQQQQQLNFSSDEGEFQYKNNNPLSLQLNSRGNLNSYNKSKVHECSICGAEFTSGQALGGHMRRHRAPIGTNTSTTLSLHPVALEPDEDQPRKKRNLLNLDLDLNLPAPEDDQRKSELAFSSKPQQQQQQASLGFSTPALVDCHY